MIFIAAQNQCVKQLSLIRLNGIKKTVFILLSHFYSPIVTGTVSKTISEQYSFHEGKH